MRYILLMLIYTFLTGCAVGQRYNYHTSVSSLPLKASVNKVLILTVEDLRPYVLDGNKKSNFVGLQRGGFGNPFDVTTASGNSLTQDMAESIAYSLENSGFHIIVSQDEPKIEQLSQLANTNNADRIVWLKVRDWKSDIYMSIGLKFDLHLAVYNATGQLLAENTLKGNEAVGGGKIGASKNSEHMSQEFAKRIGYLFNKESIRNALQRIEE